MSRLGLRLLLLASALGGCASGGPSHPPGALQESTVRVDAALIPYRTLVVQDFKGAAAPGHKPSDMEGDVAAASVIVIGTTSRRISVVAQSNADSSYYEAVVDTVCYEARFDPAHSWFNPGVKAEAGPLLEHEQIHFAIAELSARRANAAISEIRERIRSRARESTVALRLAEQRFQDELARVRREAAERQEQFDRETENGTHVRQSQYWSRKIALELQMTAEKSGFPR